MTPEQKRQAEAVRQMRKQRRKERRKRERAKLARRRRELATAQDFLSATGGGV
jgi:hypothetical protein